MKNLFKVLGIAVFTTVIVLSMTACGGAGAGGGGGFNIGHTDGKLTLNGLNAYNGKYVTVEEAFTPPPTLPLLIGGANIDSVKLSGAPIIGGTAVLKIWLCTEKTDSSTTLVNYNGSEQKTMEIVFWEIEHLSYEDPYLSPIKVINISFPFSNGIATINTVDW